MSDSAKSSIFFSEVRIRCSHPTIIDIMLLLQTLFISMTKAHFLKHPGQVLLSIYFFCVFGLGYSVFVCERASPTVQPIELEVIYLTILKK